MCSEEASWAFCRHGGMFLKFVVLKVHVQEIHMIETGLSGRLRGMAAYS